MQDTGDRDGEESVQLYVSPVEAGSHNPMISLAGFDRIMLKVGEKKTLKFKIAKEQLMTVSDDLKKVIQPGEITIAIGGAQPSEDRIKDGNAVQKKITITGEMVEL